MSNQATTLDKAVSAFVLSLVEDYTADQINEAFSKIGYVRGRMAQPAVSEEAEPAKRDPEREKRERDGGYWQAFTRAMSIRGAELKIVEHRGRRGWDCTIGNSTARARVSPEAALSGAFHLEFDGNIPEGFGLPASTLRRLVPADPSRADSAHAQSSSKDQP